MCNFEQDMMKEAVSHNQNTLASYKTYKLTSEQPVSHIIKTPASYKTYKQPHEWNSQDSNIIFLYNSSYRIQDLYSQPYLISPNL